MAIYVYSALNGELYSWTPMDTDPVASADELAANGLAAVFSLPPLDQAHAWDAATKTVVSVTAPPIPKPVETGAWILRFTPQEFQAITTSTDPVVQQFLFALNHTTQIDLATPTFTNGIAYLAAVSLLAQGRIAAILAGA